MQMKEKKEKAPAKGKVRVKTQSAVEAFRIINSAKLTKMETSERYAMIIITRQLKKVKDEYDAIIKDAQEKFKPEGFDEIASKVQSNAKLSPSERAVLQKFNNEMEECVNTAHEKEVELEIEPLGKEAFEHFLDSNDFKTGEILVIEDLVTETRV